MLTPTIKLGSRVVSSQTPPYIIAEIGVNHEGSLETAKTLIDLAKKSGADAAKFQSYKADSLASVKSPAYWDTNKEPTKSQYELFKKFDSFTPFDYQNLASYCREKDIEFLSTPFDIHAVEFLDPLVSFFKIASADLTNIPLLRHVASKLKPVLLSTGASSYDEINVAVRELREHGCLHISLLHCVLNYPTANDCAHLRMINGLQRAYPDLVIGYSDHTLPDEHMTALTTAFSMGAVIIEKHFTNDKNLPGNDHYHAMDYLDLSTFKRLSTQSHILLGQVEEKAPLVSEDIARQNARRSIVVKHDLPKNHKLSEQDLTCKRPGTGISPLYWDDVIGKRTSRLLKVDDLLQWTDLVG